MNPIDLARIGAICKGLTSPQTVKEVKTLSRALKKKSRFKEPSTWASISGLCATLVALFPVAAPVLGPVGIIAAGVGYYQREERHE